jgi:RimJ/RimL family protein N-acetyltransferase
MQEQGDRLPFAVVETASGRVLGTTGYHNILPEVRRLEIGYTWYGASSQRTYVYTACKLMLLTHAFDTLQARVVGWLTDCENAASRRAIERLGAKKDGVVRGNRMRHDGTVRDSAMYSMTAEEWPLAKQHLQHLLESALQRQRVCEQKT